MTPQQAQENRDRASAWYYANRERLGRKPRPPKRTAEEIRAVDRIRSTRRWRENAEYRAFHRKQVSAWTKARPDFMRMRSLRRRCVIEERMPPWADKKAIARLYRLAVEVQKSTGIPHHVDHIVPLNHPLVSGLHCEANLQILPARDNISKSNRVWPDMPT